MYRIIFYFNYLILIILIVNMIFVCREVVIFVWFVYFLLFMFKEESFNEMKDCIKNIVSVVEKRSVYVFIYGVYVFNLILKNVLNCLLFLKVVKIRCLWC